MLHFVLEVGQSINHRYLHSDHLDVEDTLAAVFASDLEVQSKMVVAHLIEDMTFLQLLDVDMVECIQQVDVRRLVLENIVFHNLLHNEELGHRMQDIAVVVETWMLLAVLHNPSSL